MNLNPSKEILGDFSLWISFSFKKRRHFLWKMDFDGIRYCNILKVMKKYLIILSVFITWKFQPIDKDIIQSPAEETPAIPVMAPK